MLHLLIHKKTWQKKERHPENNKKETQTLGVDKFDPWEKHQTIHLWCYSNRIHSYLCIYSTKSTYAWLCLHVYFFHTHIEWHAHQLQRGRSDETPHPFLFQQCSWSAVRRRKWSCQRRGRQAGCWRFICSGRTAEVAGVKLLHLLTTPALNKLFKCDKETSVRLGT